MKKSGSVLRIETFGGLAIRLSDRKLSGFASRKAEAILVYLATTGQTAPRSVLANLFWENSSESQASTNLRVALSSLKKQLDPYLAIDRQSVRFRSSANVWLDTLAMERHLTDQDLEAGLALYKGDFLEGFFLQNCRTFEEWQTVTRERHRLRIQESLHDGVSECLSRGALKIGLRYARRLLDLDPFDEVALRRMLELLARTGQRNAAVREFERYESIYAEELGVEPDSATMDLFNRIRQGENQAVMPLGLQHIEALFQTTQPDHRSLPEPLTPFVGRRVELTQLEAMLSDPEIRLVTILGSGGSGKTRLCQEAGRSAVRRFEDGVIFVPLISISEPEALVSAVAMACGLQPEDKTPQKNQLLNFLAPRNLLLFLDNFETVLMGAPFVAEILQRAPGLKIISTSREKLNLRGEHVFRLLGLDFTQDSDSSGVAWRDSTELFLQTARRLNPDVPTDPNSLADIARICRLVEGMPLAIELAASWADTLTLAEIDDQIEAGLDILAVELEDLPPRHQSIQLVFDGSCQSLDPQTRACFAALSVFRGNFTGRAAREIAGASIHQLKILVKKSLLTLMGTGRYQLHELLRQYAAEILAESPGNEAKIRASHSRYYREFLSVREEELIGGRITGREKARIAMELRNMRAGFRWAVENGMFEAALDFLPGLNELEEATNHVALLGWAVDTLRRRKLTAQGNVLIGLLLVSIGLNDFYSANKESGQAKILETRSILQSVVPAESPYLAEANMAAARTLSLGTGYDYLPMIRTALHTFRSDYRVRTVLAFAGEHAFLRNDQVLAETHFRDLAELAEPLHERRWLAEAYFGLGRIAADKGKFPKAIDFLQKSILMFAETDSFQMAAVVHKHLGLIHLISKQFDAAQQHFRKSLAFFEKIGVKWRVVETFIYLGETMLTKGDLEGAQAYYAEAQSAYQAEGKSSIGGFLQGDLGWLATMQRNYPDATALFLSVLHEPWGVDQKYIIPQTMVRAIPLLETFDHHTLVGKIAAFILTEPLSRQLNTKQPARVFMENLKSDQGPAACEKLLSEAGSISLDDLQRAVEGALIAIQKSTGLAALSIEFQER